MIMRHFLLHAGIFLLAAVLAASSHADRLVFGSYRAYDSALSEANRLSSLLGATVQVIDSSPGGSHAANIHRVVSLRLNERDYQSLGRRADAAGIGFWRLRPAPTRVLGAPANEDLSPVPAPRVSVEGPKGDINADRAPSHNRLLVPEMNSASGRREGNFSADDRGFGEGPALEIELQEIGEGLVLLKLRMSQSAPYEYAVGRAEVVISWPRDASVMRLKGMPTADSLRGTPISSITFAGDGQNALKVRHMPGFGVTIVSDRQAADSGETVVLKFQALNNWTLKKTQSTSDFAPASAGQEQAISIAQRTNLDDGQCQTQDHLLLPRAANTVCKPVGGEFLTLTAHTAYDDVNSTEQSQARQVDVVVAERPALAQEISPAQIKGVVPRPQPNEYAAAIPVPDRWRILQGLGPQSKWYDPYNQNTLKADLPLHDDWFFNVTATSDTFAEVRTVPTPVGLQSSASAGSNDVFGDYEQTAVIQNFAMEFVYYKGDTVFKPVDWEFRFTPVINLNSTRLDEILGVNADPGAGKVRRKSDVGIQSAFVDKHLWNVSDNYDFDSIRVGIQPFSSDFRGFLFQDSPFGVRLFGNRFNNKLQYNLAWFRRLDKDVNSGLNDVKAGLRDDDLLIANVYLQDMPRLGFFSEFLFAYNRNRETSTTFDDNNFITRPASIGLEIPRKYDAYYFGLGGDGHFGRLNLTTQFFWVTGKEKDGLFTGTQSDINGLFFAAEPSIDLDWLRLKMSLLYASGDGDPYDNKSQAFDAIFENPIFAGADTSYWIRQAVPLLGGGRVTLSGRNGLLNSMRSSKEQGQSNFTNPGLILYGVGADADILPQLRLALNANYLRFEDTAVLEVARATTGIDDAIGLDLSASMIWRPLMTQNIIVRLSYASLIADKGYADLYGDSNPYSFLANMVFTW